MPKLGPQTRLTQPLDLRDRRCKEAEGLGIIKRPRERVATFTKPRFAVGQRWSRSREERVTRMKRRRSWKARASTLFRNPRSVKPARPERFLPELSLEKSKLHSDSLSAASSTFTYALAFFSG
ncbi:hypothetical protein KM043_000746 [Ampulex compressa]|nr:hypothetical protein KM043_000746 [Ampulex compressa]